MAIAPVPDKPHYKRSEVYKTRQRDYMNATFGLVLLLGIYLGVGAVTFHIIERSGLTK